MLTIAHRLETIADFDIIVVMDNGTVAESGLPYVLLSNKEGYFSGMVGGLGTEAKANFLSIAKRRADLR